MSETRVVAQQGAHRPSRFGPIPRLKRERPKDVDLLVERFENAQDLWTGLPLDESLHEEWQHAYCQTECGLTLEEEELLEFFKGPTVCDNPL